MSNIILRNNSEEMNFLPSLKARLMETPKLRNGAWPGCEMAQSRSDFAPMRGWHLPLRARQEAACR